MKPKIMMTSTSTNDDSRSWQSEVTSGARFEFGANWTAFLQELTPERIESAELSLKDMLGVERLDGQRFLDAGSGSGLFSLAARRLGAEVHSFDFDPKSVACAAELRQRYFADDPHWKVESGSVLDKSYLTHLGEFDVVYSWGVLHHTGAMWQALDNVVPNVAPGGKLFVAIYNDQGLASRIWKAVKQVYVGAPRVLRPAILGAALARLWGPTVLRDTLRGHPLRSWRAYGGQGPGRGMDAWRDVVDWVGGYPFEVASPDAIRDFYASRGLELLRSKGCNGGLGCNEYVFVRHSGG
jgi:2-polyprenyl-3-methyl-5-hydroxy-6-metoxy-1,4-benzoquinol methylase